MTWVALAEQPRDRGIELRLPERLGEILVDAGAHALEHQRWIERRGEEHDVGGRMLPFQCGQLNGDLAGTPHVDEQHVGLAGLGVDQRAQVGNPGDG